MSNQSLLYSFDNHIWFDLALQTNHRYDVTVKLRRLKQTRSWAKRLLLFFLLFHPYPRYLRTSSSCPNLHSFFFQSLFCIYLWNSTIYDFYSSCCAFEFWKFHFSILVGLDFPLLYYLHSGNKYDYINNFFIYLLLFSPFRLFGKCMDIDTKMRGKCMDL